MLRLSAEAFAGIGQVLEPAAVRAATESAEPDADGWTQVVVPIGSAERALPELLSLGAGAEVVGPPLREKKRSTPAEMLARYEDGFPAQK